MCSSTCAAAGRSASHDPRKKSDDLTIGKPLPHIYEIDVDADAAWDYYQKKIKGKQWDWAKLQCSRAAWRALNEGGAPERLMVLYFGPQEMEDYMQRNGAHGGKQVGLSDDDRNVLEGKPQGPSPTTGPSAPTIASPPAAPTGPPMP